MSKRPNFVSRILSATRDDWPTAENTAPALPAPVAVQNAAPTLTPPASPDIPDAENVALSSMGEGWGDLFGSGYMGSTHVSPDRAMRHTAFYACVRLIAGTISSLPLKIYESTPDDSSKEAKHPLGRLLSLRPNPRQSARLFWSSLLALALGRGNGYAWIERTGAGRPVAIWPLLPGTCFPRGLSDFDIAYDITLLDGTRLTVTSDDIIHIPGSPEWNGLEAVSPLRAAAGAINIALAADEYAGKYFENDATPPGYLSYPGKTAPGLVDRVKEHWIARTTGVNRHSMPVLTEGGEFKQLALNAEDSQLLESRRFAVEDIARIFGVPPHMVGAVDKSTSWGSGIEQQSIGFVQFTLQPHLTAIEQEIAYKLFYGSNYYAEFSVQGLMRGDFKTRNEGYRLALGGSSGPGYLTPNEVRKYENKPPISGGDTLSTWTQAGASNASGGKDNSEANNQKDSANAQ